MTASNNSDRVAIVTGGNRGLGHECCRQLAALGYRVVLTARDTAQGEAAARALGVTFRALDVADAASCDAFAAWLDSDLKRVDILINNAGVLIDPNEDWNARESPAVGAAMDAFYQTFDVNVWGALRVAQAVIPHMRRQRWGRIVNVSSGLGRLADMGSGWPAYRMSKTALNAMTRILAAELSADGIKVNAANPGWVRTDMGGASADRSLPEGADTLVWLATLPDDGPTGGFFRDRTQDRW
jgi:NAD(P)-dependent dehydrogenase (short-subunit alcohol dehydrogenase family)